MAFNRPARIFAPFAGKDLLFESMSGHEALGRPFVFNVRVLAPATGFDARALLGDVVTVQLELPRGAQREFTGHVTHISRDGSTTPAVDAPIRYTLVVRPAFYMLANRTNCRIYQHQSVVDIASAVFNEGGVAFDVALFNKYPKLEYSVQYRESDFNYVSRLLEGAGIYYFFRHEVGKHTLVLADSPSSHFTREGYSILDYNETPPQGTEGYLKSWRIGLAITTGRYGSVDYDFKKPNAHLVGSCSDPSCSHPYDSLEMFDYPGKQETASDADVNARRRLGERRLPNSVGEGESDLRGLEPGLVFQIRNCAFQNSAQKHVVTYAHYDVRVGAYESQPESSTEQPFHCMISTIDNERDFVPSRETPEPVVEGPQTAVVVGPDGEEIFTDEYGRIKVQFHWDRYGKANEESSCWVRVAQTWAGAGFGAQFIPRIGQEVLVDFVHGDPDRPIVIGSLYNGFNRPPNSLPMNATQSGIRTHSSKKGGVNDFNEIRFEDKKGEEDLFVQAQRTQTTVVKASQSVSVGASQSISVGKDRSVTVDRNESLTVKGTQTENITQLVNQTYGADHTQTVTGAQIITAASHITTAKGGILMEQTKTTYLNLNGDVWLNAAGIITIKRGSVSITLDGDNMTLSAPAMIRLESGSSSLVLAPGNCELSADSIALTGDQVLVTGTKTVDLDGGGSKVGLASGGVTASGTTIKLNS